jgi:hypothetical protein
MDFGLTQEQEMIVETTRSFVENELYPHEAVVERTGHLDMDLVREIQAKAIAAGLYAANIPEEFGGAGLDTPTWLSTKRNSAAPITRCTGPAWRARPIFSVRARPSSAPVISSRAWPARNGIAWP